MTTANDPGPAQRARSAIVIAAACAIAAWLSGCSSPCTAGSGRCRQDAAERGPTASGDDMVCIEEPQTGSHIVETRCYRRSALDERREEDRAILEKALIRANQPRRTTRDQ